MGLPAVRRQPHSKTGKRSTTYLPFLNTVKEHFRNKPLSFCFSFLRSKIKTDLMSVCALYGAGNTVTITQIS